ncbi:MAG: hypothetical protein CME62_04655 [Halobacteriovoraceae bacterium]|nr:hypothetical protein [Halobacteriovoraceae bacterium]|tara:strand:+ start:5057 stop:6445 length:1389 start_codon:yes stop_codon:yes gene_type:complete
MYIFCLFITALAIAGQGEATHLKLAEKRQFNYPLGKLEEKELAESTENIKEYGKIRLLHSVKLAIINGQLEKAKILLREATLSDDFSRTTQIRYLALIHFLENNHEEVVRLLNTSEMLNISTLPQVCLINSMSLLILNKQPLLKKRWKDCKAISMADSINQMSWMQVLIDLRLRDPKVVLENLFKNTNVDNLNKEQLRIVLKLALYLNEQDKIIPRFPLLTEEILSNRTYRELIGMNYFRDLNLTKAYDLLNDLDSANAEVFKGNLFLSQKKFLKAYGQFKLALALKENSSNALERLIPLAWQLNQYNEGTTFVQKLEFKPSEELYQLTLLALFSTMSDDIDAADTYLKRLQARAFSRNPVEIQQLLTYIGVIKNNDYDIDINGNTNCMSKDGIHCWLMYYKYSWPNPIDNLTSERKIHDYEVSLLDKYSQEAINEPLDHPELINQKDIEELDNNLIKLIQD